MNNIECIVSQDFCIGCGSCEFVCPHNAISSIYKDGMFLPLVNPSVCTDCGLCLKGCPSYKIDACKVYPKMDMGNVDYPSYTVWSHDAEIRKLGTSGGAISTMIIALLESKQYEKAYVLEYETFNDEKAILKPVFDREGVLKSVKSKYIPASVEQVIEDIKTNIIGKAIIVATPCQLLAIKRYLELRKKTDEDLLYLGLFCDKTEKYSIYEYFEKKFGPYQALHFRDKEISGWPGNVLLKQDGCSIDIPREERMAVKEQFQMNRCNYCFDKLNMLADISFGDCYLSEFSSDKLGRSSIVLRTKKGKSVFNSIKSSFEILPSSFEKIKLSQHIQLKQANLCRNTSQSAVYTNPPQEFIKNMEKKSSKNKIINKLRKVKRIVQRLLKGRVLPQIIFIDNVGFVNKGDQLMIESVVKQLKEHRPDAQIVLRKDVFYQNPNYCIQKSILPLYTPKKGLKGLRYRIAINLLINKNWLISPDMVDVILDCRGYHLGDPWIKDPLPTESKSYADYLEAYYAQFSKPSCKIILLSQALGPFGNEESKKCVRLVNEKASKIYAREATSYEYLKAVLPNMDKVSICPDFTCLHIPTESAPIQIPNDYVLLIPNARMMDQTDSLVANNYMIFLQSIVDYMTNLGEKVYLLNHEGMSDEILLQDLNSKLLKPLPIITKQTGIDIKQIISNSKLLITARFHGAVSGLTQGVPTLCTSWSHKYSELLNEHQCENNLLDVLDVESAKHIIADALENPNKYASKDGCIQKVESRVEKMWKDVFSII